MTMQRMLVLVVLLCSATAAKAQTCPAGNPRVAPDSRYSITEPVAGQQVVTDLATGLIWQRCSEGQSGAACGTGSATPFTWTAALTQANSSTHAGFSDWRLPNREELRSLVEIGCSSPSINPAAFPATPSSSYWSSTTYASIAASSAWAVRFLDGPLIPISKVSDLQVRLVRGGQWLDPFAAELDAVPDAFNLLPQVSVPRAELRTSDPVTISGLTTVTGIGVSGAPGSSYSINGGPFSTQPGAVRNGDVVRVRHTSSAAHSSPTTTVLTIGGVTGEFVTLTANIRLNDTAQITCYEAFASTGTVSTGTPDPETAGFDEQDCTRGAAAADALGRMVKVGGSTAPGRDYTKIANDGSVLPAAAVLGTGPTDWACTRDNVTGLMWEVKVNDAANLRHRDHTYTWYDTNSAVNGGNAGTEAGTGCGSTLPNCNTTAYRDAINALSGSARLCGAADWRLPTGSELSGLVHAGLAAGPTIDATWFPNTVSQFYWTGETYAPSASDAWNVDFNDGFLYGVNKNSLLRRVRLVRGGQ